jgi:predicted short-subunit dehydrogenase-like oxidoreductase (DUF2520 family)
MRIVMIGAGNMATRLGIASMNAGHEIAQVYSRTMQSAEALAEQLHSNPVIQPECLVSDAELYISAVKDDVLNNVLSKISFGDGILVHTAGSLPLDVLQTYSTNIGVFYPFQTFSKNREVDYSEVPIYIDAKDAAIKQRLQDLAHTLSNNVFEANDEKRLSLHVAAVFACNFVNYMYSVAYDIVTEKGLSFQELLPLIRETARKVETLSPIDAQTGPAIRMDRNVLDKHLQYLNDQPELADIYETLTQGIYKRQKNS